MKDGLLPSMSGSPMVGTAMVGGMRNPETPIAHRRYSSLC